LAYPIFLAVIGFLVLNILVVFFVPKFEPIFKKLEESNELPGITLGLMGTSHFLQQQGWWVILLAIGGVVLFRRWAATDRGRLIVDTWRLHAPGAGTIYLHLALSRFTRILGTLLHNGIPILQSLKIAKDSTGNRVLTQAISDAGENIKAGDSLAAPPAACQHFPRDAVGMMAVGRGRNNLETGRPGTAR